MHSIPYEIDYLQVGDGEKSGDAIALRFGNLTGPRSEQMIVVIDGGTNDTGTTMVEHIKQWYGGTDEIDYVISTHPDSDHAAGLRTVLEEMKVGTLLMHRPWDHAEDVKAAFSDGRWTERGLGYKFEKSIRFASDLEYIANQRGTKIVEPFQGIATSDGSIRVLGPTVDFYRDLLPHFRSTPKAKEGLLGSLVQKATSAVEWMEDEWGLDLLGDDEDTTSAENNSSAIVLFNLDGRRLLFTGDAGKTALHHAADHATALGISLTGLEFMHVPHHGSRRNLSSSVLARINTETAYISASTGSSKHPSKKVTNALKKTGAKVFKTNGNTIGHRHLAESRGWGGIEEEPFHQLVEA